MSDEFSKLNLHDDFVEAGEVPESSRWILEMPSYMEVRVTLSPAREPNEKFQARLLWATYPDDPPSLKFLDIATGRIDMPQAWPVGRGFRPQNLDACCNWCAEGFLTHPEWKRDPLYQWNTNGNCLLWVLRQLQEELDEHYQGRFK